MVERTRFVEKNVVAKTVFIPSRENFADIRLLIPFLKYGCGFGFTQFGSNIEELHYAFSETTREKHMQLFAVAIKVASQIKNRF